MARTGGSVWAASWAPWLHEADAAATFSANHVVADQLNAGTIEGFNDFGERINDAPNVAAAGFHALDGRQRDAGQLGKLALIDAQ
jgi:hypothetical protein